MEYFACFTSQPALEHIAAERARDAYLTVAGQGTSAQLTEIEQAISDSSEHGLALAAPRSMPRAIRD